MRFVIMWISPDIASEMLKRNIRNRPVKRQQVIDLAEEMRSGRWKMNGDAIRFGVDGTLIDGQHRLMAVIESAKTIQFAAAYDVEEGSFDTIDVGRKRSISDTLSVCGEINTSHLAAALKVVCEYESGLPFSGKRFTNIDAEETLANHPELRVSVSYCHTTRGLIPNSVASSCHYLFSRIDKELANEFIDRLIDGTAIDSGHPILVLRNKLIDNKKAKGKLANRYLMALTIRAWNHFVRGDKVKILKWDEYREEFPRPEQRN